MNPEKTVHKLDGLLSEIRTYRDTNNQYYKDMMNHLHDMCLRTLLEFTGKRIESIPKVQIDSMVRLLHIFRATEKAIMPMVIPK